MQFIEKYRQAIKETARVLKSAGKLLVMLLNPRSEFFREKATNPTSYLSKIKHANLEEIERTIADYFVVQAEYFLGIKGQDTFETQEPDLASLYIIKGRKKQGI